MILPTLVTDWRHCHKWLSMRFLALGAVAQAAVIGATTTGMAQNIQPWLLTGLSDFAIFCTLAAGVGRVIAQPNAKGPSDEPSGS